MNKNIKFIYFDVGGVAILDFSKTNKWLEMTKALGVTDSIRNEFDDIFKRFEQEICISKNSLELFIDLVKSKWKLNIPENYSMLDDFVNRFEANKSLYPILTKLSKEYKLGLLTNMYPNMLERIKQRNIMPPIKWDVVIDSSVVDCMKPQDRIYELAESESGFKSNEILFVENSIANIEAAKERGWQTVLYDPSDISGSNKKLKEKIEV